MKLNLIHVGQLLVVLACLTLHVIRADANKKLRKIILASLISKSLKSHMNQQQALVPVVIPPLNQ